MNESAYSLEKIKVNLETSKIPWSELQRFFASGQAIAVAADLDLVEVACQFAVDNKVIVEQWLRANQISRVSDLQAKDWLENRYQVWAVVVKPWVLVQPISPE
jgi:hypothetical protein